MKSLGMTLLALGVACCTQGQGPERLMAEPMAEASSGASAAPASITSTRTQDATQALALRVPTGLAEYICGPSDPNCRSNGDPFVASSEDEARWLSHHGYPSNAEFSRLALLTPSQLEAEAASGGGAAAVMYAKKMAMQPGRFSEGVLHLHDLAVSGNLYAYYGLSELYWRHAEYRNLVDSAAYLRVAYLLGDWKAADQLARLNLPQAELAAADRRAASLLSTFSGGMAPSRRPPE